MGTELSNDKRADHRAWRYSQSEQAKGAGLTGTAELNRCVDGETDVCHHWNTHTHQPLKCGGGEVCNETAQVQRVPR